METPFTTAIFPMPHPFTSILPAELEPALSLVPIGQAYPLLGVELTIAQQLRNPARRLGFAAGRFAARTSLSHWGLPPLPLPRLANGAPGWPRGLLGSISHSSNYAVALTLPLSLGFQGLGIDLEEAQRPINEGILGKIALPEEIQQWKLQQGAGENAFGLDTKKLFSMKEAIYKALSSCCGYFGFDKARLVDLKGPKALFALNPALIALGAPKKIQVYSLNQAGLICSLACWKKSE